MGGDNIGRVMVIEFDERDSATFDEITDILKRYPDFGCLKMKAEPIVSLPGLEIYLDRHKIYCGRREINLTAKEYDILCLLVANKGCVLTYGQIYEKVWGEASLGNESNAISCHVRNLREKLYAESPDAPFNIRCVREIGYCFEIKTEK